MNDVTHNQGRERVLEFILVALPYLGLRNGLVHEVREGRPMTRGFAWRRARRSTGI